MSIQTQALLLDNPVATIKTCHILHSATLLPTEMGSLEHDYIEIIDMIYSSHPNLGSEPLPNAKEKWFTGGRSLMKVGKRLAGSIGTFETQVVEARSLPPGTLAKKAELIVLT